MSGTAKSNTLKKKDNSFKNLYVFWCVLLAGLNAYMLPYFMDFYVLRSSKKFFFFYEYHVVGNVKILLISSFIIFFVTCFFYGLCLRLDAALGLTEIPFLILTYASYLKYEIRQEMMNWQDLKITEAANLAKNSLKSPFDVYFLWIIGFLILVIGFAIFVEVICKEKKTSWKGKKAWSIRGSVVLGTVLFLVIAVPFFLKNAESPLERMKLIGKPSDTQQNGCVLYSFLQNESTLLEGDPEEAMERLMDGANELPPCTDSGVRPNVICIMSESFWNTDYLKDTEIVLSKDPMESYWDIEDAVHGQVGVNIYGGGTISSELEYFMGINTKYFSSSVSIAPELGKGKVKPSMIDYFDTLGYYSVFIHPYDSSFYSRERNYERFGFQKQVFEPQMKYTELYDSYISDESLANQIIFEYEEKDPDAPLFLWSVSVAAHGQGMDAEHPFYEDYPYPVDVDWENTKLDENGGNKLKREINNVYLANESFAMLVDYFSRVDEPTVILMYGDHNPNVSNETDILTGRNLLNYRFEDIYAQYSTPMILWKNYTEAGTTPEDLCGENIQYLPGVLFEYAGLPECDMTRIIRYVNSRMKSNTVKFIMDSEGKTVDNLTEEQIDVFVDFGVLQNDIVFGDGDYSQLWIPYENE